MCGCYLDIILVPYAFLWIVGGTIISIIGAAMWLRNKENIGVIGSKHRIRVTAVINGQDGVYVLDKISIED